MKITTHDSMLGTPVRFGGGACAPAGVHASTWAAPVQGIAMSAPATRLGGTAVTTTTVPANAAKGADRKRTAGYEAFEDPL
jgi:hypothetical protein